MIDDTPKMKAGADPGGATGVQDTDWPSLDKARVPSFFLYAAEPLGGAISLPCKPLSVERVHLRYKL